MPSYSCTHLADHELLASLRALVAHDRLTTAAMLAHLAEVDERRLYLPAGYPSLYSWCVGELKLSEDAAWKRIQAAGVARTYPAILDAVAAGRLHLSAVMLLAPHLTGESSKGLLVEASGKSKRELEALLAVRFPRPEVPTVIRPLTAPLTNLEPAPGQVAMAAPAAVQHRAPDPASERVQTILAASTPPARVRPLAPQRFALQVTLSQQTHDKLRRAQELLGHVVASGDVASVLDRALDELIARLERRKCGAARRPRKQTQAPRGRNIPAAIRREVWRRDGGRCTFVGDSGHRCDEHSRLEVHGAQARLGVTGASVEPRLRPE